MTIIPLQAIPNQILSIQLDNNTFDIAIRSINNTPQTPGTALMTFSVSINGVQIISNQRMLDGWPLIPYQYLWTYGNFFMITDNDEYADYTQFGITQYLIYATLLEIEAGLL